VAPFFAAELTGLARIVRQPIVEELRPSDVFVAAARVFGDHRGWRYSVVGAFEAGRVAVPTDPGNDDPASLLAGAVAGRVEWETALPWRLTFGAQGAFATGGPPEDGTGDTSTFDPILPDSHANHGQHAFYAWSNLIEAGGDVGIHPIDELGVKAGYRFAGLADANGPWVTGQLFPVGRSATNESQLLGHVVSLDVELIPWEPLRFGASYGLLVLGDGAKNIYRDTRAEQPDAQAPDLSHFGMLDARLRLP
jgi:hypothetical protein